MNDRNSGALSSFFPRSCVISLTSMRIVKTDIDALSPLRTVRVSKTAMQGSDSIDGREKRLSVRVCGVKQAFVVQRPGVGAQ